MTSFSSFGTSSETRAIGISSSERYQVCLWSIALVFVTIFFESFPGTLLNFCKDAESYRSLESASSRDGNQNQNCM